MMEKSELYSLTMEKLRNLIMKTPMCREGKNCKDIEDEPDRDYDDDEEDRCKYADFCSIWKNLWPYAYTEEDGPVKNCADYKTKDLPAVIIGFIADAEETAFNGLYDYMRANNLFFNSDNTDFVKGEEKEQ
jgi:hypothetical protein